MRYRFLGLMRSTGKPVEGHVEADSEEWAFHALANNGIITESLRPDPKAGLVGPATAAPTSRAAEPLLPPYMPPAAYGTGSPSPTRPATPPGTFQMAAAGPAQTMVAPPSLPPADGEPDDSAAPKSKFDNALEGALDGASSQIDFDALTDRYRGKKVWVIDRDKIRRNVARVVDQAISQSLTNDEGTSATRERVADAINELFKDTRNLTSQHSATNVTLEKQIGRLAGVIKQFEGSLASMQASIRNIAAGGGGGGGGTRRSRNAGAPAQKQEQNSVLLEIFKTNLDLLRGMEEEMRTASGAALDEVIADTGSEVTAGEPVAVSTESTGDGDSSPVAQEAGAPGPSGEPAEH